MTDPTPGHADDCHNVFFCFCHAVGAEYYDGTYDGRELQPTDDWEHDWLHGE